MDDSYENFTVSQLFEMLPMQEAERKQITPDMPVRRIREVKNEIKRKEDKKEAQKEADGIEKEKGKEQLPGQTSLTEDFPEWLPEDLKEEKTIEPNEAEKAAAKVSVKVFLRQFLSRYLKITNGLPEAAMEDMPDLIELHAKLFALRELIMDTMAQLEREYLDE